jgi:hypothetical protein
MCVCEYIYMHMYTCSTRSCSRSRQQRCMYVCITMYVSVQNTPQGEKGVYYKRKGNILWNVQVWRGIKEALNTPQLIHAYLYSVLTMYKKHRLENNTEVPDLCSVSFEQINMALFGSVKHLIKIVGKQNARIKKLEMMLNIENDDDVDDDTYIRMYVCIIRMYVCIYVCMYIYIHILSLALSLSHTHASTYTQTHKLYIYIYIGSTRKLQQLKANMTPLKTTPLQPVRLTRASSACRSVA